MKKIYIAQYYTENLTHGPFAERINEKYANENGYGYYCEKSNTDIVNYLQGAAPTWYKPKLILDVIEKFSPDYILFLDTDAIISDTNDRIESFINEDYNFIAARDESTHSLMNAGVFLIKNCEWSNDSNFIFHAYAYGQIKNRTIDKIHDSIFGIVHEYDNTKLSSLAEKYYTDKHFGHNYFDGVYQREFEKIRESAKKVVELGVHEGQSINIWREFFINAEIVGIDCQLNRAEIDDYNRVKLLQFTIGDKSDKDLIDFSNDNTDIDLFIDDGSHSMKDQQVVFAKVFKSIKSGGIFVLEDLHTSVSVKNDPNSIWKSEKDTITLDMLEHFNETGKIISDYMTEDECRYLEENIESCEIFKIKHGWSYTSIIRKK